MTLKTELENAIRERRPNLSTKSVNTYVSTLKNLPFKVMNVIDIELYWFDENVDRILDYLKDIEPSKRKSILSAIFVLTNNEIIHKQMLLDTNLVNESYRNQKKSPSQEKNWIDWENVLNFHQQLTKDVFILFKKKIISPEDFIKINDYVLLSCFVLIEPRRVMDFALMKLRNYDLKTDNYVLKDKIMIFNQYKTAKQYGQQSIEIPKELQTIIKKWKQINLHDNLFVSSNFKPMSSSQITKRLNNIFGKNISANILRHSYLTHKYQNIPSLKSMQQTAKNMGHSVETALEYIKQ